LPIVAVHVPLCSADSPRPQPYSTPLPYTTLFRSRADRKALHENREHVLGPNQASIKQRQARQSHEEHQSSGHDHPSGIAGIDRRSEEHTSELQSRENIVCRLLLERKNNETLRNQI